jgi:hypothetical protein
MQGRLFLDLGIRAAWKVIFDKGGRRVIIKQRDEHDHQVLVTFELPASIWAERITVVGDFNDWDPTAHPLVQTRDNENWHITLALQPNRTYRFRYLIDGRQWSNELHADGYASTEDGIPCSVIKTDLVELPVSSVAPQPIWIQPRVRRTNLPGSVTEVVESQSQ